MRQHSAGGLRIALIASSRFPIHQPFAGGLEAQTWYLAKGLRKRGHDVTIFAGAGCDPELDVHELPAAWPQISAAARADVSMSAPQFINEHHAYLELMIRLAETAAADFDIVHNNSLHHLPVAMARLVPRPMVTTLHTPPTPWLESAIQVGPCPIQFVAVSRYTAQSWAHAAPGATVISNGIDLNRWKFGTGGGPLIWSGRLVREKAPELAIQAARESGLPLELAGPISDPQFFRDVVEPLLGGSITYVGHLDHEALAAKVGAASATLVTPRWDEPFGLVAAESLACGTPVCGFRRGGLPEVVTPENAVLVDADDVGALSAAIGVAVTMSRAAARQHAVETLSVDRMVQRYEDLFLDLNNRETAA